MQIFLAHIFLKDTCLSLSDKRASLVSFFNSGSMFHLVSYSLLLLRLLLNFRKVLAQQVDIYIDINHQIHLRNLYCQQIGNYMFLKIHIFRVFLKLQILYFNYEVGKRNVLFTNRQFMVSTTKNIPKVFQFYVSFMFYSRYINGHSRNHWRLKDCNYLYL